MRRRASLLVMTIGMALVAVACGRATQQEIDQALGITPTATLSAGDIATSTSRAEAAASARAAASTSGGSASPGASGGGTTAAVGSVTQGRSAFQFNCAQCHRAGSPTNAPILAGPESPVVALSDDQIFDLIRNGTNHAPPGPQADFKISDQRIADIIAFLRSEAQ